MTGDENPDPLGEYVRVCPYCGDQFTAGHMNREFCPEKNGFKDYCKNRYKRLVKEELSFIVDDQNISEETNSEANTETEITKETPIEKNRLIIQRIMIEKSQKIVNSEILDHYNFDINYYDSRTPIPGTNNYFVDIGDYTLEWIGQEGTVLTFKITKYEHRRRN